MKRKNGRTEERKNRRANFLVLTFFSSLVLWFFCFNCYAQPVSSTELIERAREYNNSIVDYEGEVVGDVMGRGEFAWVNVNDGENAIGVWGKKDIIDNVVNYKGSYDYKGDIVRVTGIFHRACPEHGGDLDIHINNIIKVKEGFPTPHPVHFPKFAQAFGLSVVALALSILYAFKAGIKPWKKR